MISPTKKWDFNLFTNSNTDDEEEELTEQQNTSEAVTENSELLNFSELSNCCRICLSNDQDISLYNSFDQESVTFFDVAIFLTDNQFTAMDMFPTKICIDCASKLILIHKFRKKCHLSNKILHSAYKISHVNNEEAIDEEITNIKDIDENSQELATDEDELITNELENKNEIEILYNLIDNENEEIVKEQINLNINNIEIVNFDEQCENYEEEQTVEQFVEQVELGEHLIENNDDFIIDGATTTTTTTLTTEKQNTNIEFLEYEQTPNQQNTLISKRQCEYCGRIFNRKSTLDQHRNTHTGLKKFSCTECNSLFSRKSHLLIHLRIHLNLKPYKCDICEKGFIKNSDLLRHCRIHSDARNYGCEMCDKRFKRSADVISHMRVHTGDKPYRCGQCPKEYTSHSSLKKHLIKMSHHSGVRVLLQHDANPDNITYY